MAESVIPAAVANHGEGSAAASLSALRAERVAQNRRNTQSGEVIAADQPDGGGLFTLNAGTRNDHLRFSQLAIRGEDSGECAVVIAQILELPIGQQRAHGRALPDR